MSGENPYWTRKLISRRSALRSAAAAGGGLAALSLAGCGGGSTAKKPATEGQGSVVDSTKGKPGGVLKYYESLYPANTSVITASGAARWGALTQSALLGYQWGVESVPFDAADRLEPDLAQAMPEQPDQTSYVFKLRPGVKFSNGRPLTSEDVKYSFDRYANLDTSLMKSAWQVFYDRVETPDPLTVVFKTKFPFLDTLGWLGSHRGEAHVFAKEHEEGPDATTRMVGSGPFIFVESSPPLSATFRKNPDHHLKPYPYFDQVQVFAAPDDVKRRADFYSRQVHLPWTAYPTERDDVRKNRPDAKVVEVKPYIGHSVFMRTDKPPFNDKRVRQALSVAMDRKKLRDGAQAGEGREEQFFPIQYKRIFGTREPNELGDTFKYWKYDPAEAKKLLAAAGIDKPIETTMSHVDASQAGQWLPDLATLTQASWRDAGVAIARDITQPVAQFGSTTARGQYDGTAFHINTGLGSGIALGPVIRDVLYWGPTGDHSPLNTSYTNHPRLSELADKQLRTFSAEDRKSIYREMELILAEEQSRICDSSSSQSWFRDPSVQNASQAADIGGRRYAMKWWFA